MRKRSCIIAGLIGATALGLSALPAAAAQKVERDKVAVMAGPGSFFPKSGELKLGDEVEVVAEKGAWLQVKKGALSGFVPRSALSPKKEGGLASLGKAIGSSDASASSETAGVKGFNPDVESAHAKSRGLDWSLVEKLDRQSVTPAEVQAFLAKRGLGGLEARR